MTETTIEQSNSLADLSAKSEIESSAINDELMNIWERHRAAVKASGGIRPWWCQRLCLSRAARIGSRDAWRRG
jgi:hypothetical protein